MATEQNAPMCSWCRRGRHLACIGIKCRCTLTERCAANALLTEEREKRDPGGDAA